MLKAIKERTVRPKGLSGEDRLNAENVKGTILSSKLLLDSYKDDYTDDRVVDRAYRAVYRTTLANGKVIFGFTSVENGIDCIDYRVKKDFDDDIVNIEMIADTDGTNHYLLSDDKMIISREELQEIEFAEGTARLMNEKAYSRRIAKYRQQLLKELETKKGKLTGNEYDKQKKEIDTLELDPSDKRLIDVSLP
jgi:Zn-dependent metalloprotease